VLVANGIIFLRKEGEIIFLKYKVNNPILRRNVFYCAMISIYLFCLARCSSIFTKFSTSDESLGANGITLSSSSAALWYSSSYLPISSISIFLASSLNSSIFLSQNSLN